MHSEWSAAAAPGARSSRYLSPFYPKNPGSEVRFPVARSKNGPWKRLYDSNGPDQVVCGEERPADWHLRDLGPGGEPNSRLLRRADERVQVRTRGPAVPGGIDRGLLRASMGRPGPRSLPSSLLYIVG